MTGSRLSPPDRDLPSDHSAGAQEEPHENGSDYRDHERPQASDSVRVQTNHCSSPQERLNRIDRHASGGDFTKSDAVSPSLISARSPDDEDRRQPKT